MQPALRTTVPKMGCGYAVCAVLGIAGIALLVAANRKWQNHERATAWLAGGCGAVFCCASVGLIPPMRRAVASAQEQREREDRHPDEPWKWNPAWFQRSIAPSASRFQGARWWSAFVLLALGVPGLIVYSEEIRSGTAGGWLMLGSTLIGATLLVYTLWDVLRRKGFGAVRLVPAEIPFQLGGELVGMIVTDRVVTPSAPARARLECTRTTVSEVNSDAPNRDEVIGQSESEIAASDWSSDRHGTRIFVRLPVRGGAASTVLPAAPGGSSCEWRLRVEVPTRGADLVAEFVVPVF